MDVLGYSFRDEAHIEQALMHSSFRSSQELSNERLEFLGDRILGAIMAHAVYRNRSAVPNQGRMAILYNYLVCQDACATIAREINLEEYMLVGQSERREPLKKAILADACEAVIGAVYLDGGFEVAQECVLRMWHRLLERAFDPSEPITLDPKTLLQQWAQKKGLPLPRYEVVRQEGKAHTPVFTIGVLVEGYQPLEASGSSKKEAENEAARSFLGALGIHAANRG